MKNFFHKWYGDECPSWTWPAMAGLIALLLMMAVSIGAHAQQYDMPGPPMWGPDVERWGPAEQRRRLPPRFYDPYDPGPERFGPQPRPVDPEEYARRAYCAMHPRECY